MKILNKSIFLMAMLAMSLFVCSTNVVRAEDEIEDDDDAVITDEPTVGDDASDPTTVTETDTEEEEGGAEKQASSPYVKTNVLFVQPESSDLPAGRLVKMLVGFQNNGTSSFIVDSIEGSFRYPQDFSYHIQNFSVFDFVKTVEAEREATFDYLFTPSEIFSSRQFGLTINLRYRNLEGKLFVNTVFNDTISVVEPDEGLDGETFFLYIFLAAIGVLVCFGLYQFLSVFKKKGRSTKSTYSSSAQKLSNGNSANSNDVDMEWIPKEHLQTNKSPKVSPRQRKIPRNGATTASGNSSNDEQ